MYGKNDATHGFYSAPWWYQEGFAPEAFAKISHTNAGMMVVVERRILHYATIDEDCYI